MLYTIIIQYYGIVVQLVFQKFVHIIGWIMLAPLCYTIWICVISIKPLYCRTVIHLSPHAVMSAVRYVLIPLCLVCLFVALVLLLLFYCKCQSRRVTNNHNNLFQQRSKSILLLLFLIYETAKKGATCRV